MLWSQESSNIFAVKLAPNSLHIRSSWKLIKFFLLSVYGAQPSLPCLKFAQFEQFSSVPGLQVLSGAAAATENNPRYDDNFLRSAPIKPAYLVIVRPLQQCVPTFVAIFLAAAAAAAGISRTILQQVFSGLMQQ
jgi:hypothetical protein